MTKKSHYCKIKEREMDRFLSRRGFQEIQLSLSKEKVYARFYRSESGRPFSLRVYTSIEDGEARDCGNDAIRVAIFTKDDEGEIVPVGKRKRVNRIKTWKKNLSNRLNTWQDLLGPNCPKGHGPMIERKGKYGKFWGCNQYPKCRCTK